MKSVRKLFFNNKKGVSNKFDSHDVRGLQMTKMLHNSNPNPLFSHSPIQGFSSILPFCRVPSPHAFCRFRYWIYTVQTLDLILLCTRCIPQMHFWIASKIYLHLLPCLESNVTKQGNLAPRLKELFTLSVEACQTLVQIFIQSATLCA